MIDITTFTTIPGFSRYSISRDGELYDHTKNRLVASRKSLTSAKKQYYRTSIKSDEGNWSRQFTHRLLALVFIPNPDNKKLIDHVDGNGLNNDLNNLRWCTSTENQQNRKRGTGTSKYIGVYWHKSRKTWRTVIVLDGKPKQLGEFADQVEAAKAYDIAAKKYGFLSSNNLA